MPLFRRRPTRAKHSEFTVTDLPSGGRVVASGEQWHKEGIQRALGAARPYPPTRLESTRRFGCTWDVEAFGWITATLIREPGNPFDPNAVAVWSSEWDQLGYLPRARAAEYQPVMLGLESRGSTGAACPAYIAECPWGDTPSDRIVVLCLSSAAASAHHLGLAQGMEHQGHGSGRSTAPHPIGTWMGARPKSLNRDESMRPRLTPSLTYPRFGWRGHWQ